jgi:hypothetical protein
MTSHFTARLGLLCAAAAALTCTGARAQEGVAIKNLLGTIGVISPEKDPIHYRERAPLVLPPKMELRAPAGAESYASSNPQWPTDPEVSARRRRAAEERVPTMDSQTRRMADSNPRLTVEELRGGRNPGAQGPGPLKYDNPVMNPRELQSVRSSGETDAETAPVRRTLTDPPTVLRKTARGGPVQRDFQGKVDQQQHDANPINWFVDKFKSKDDD